MVGFCMQNLAFQSELVFYHFEAVISELQSSKIFIPKRSSGIHQNTIPPVATTFVQPLQCYLLSRVCIKYARQVLI